MECNTELYSVLQRNPPKPPFSKGEKMTKTLSPFNKGGVSVADGGFLGNYTPPSPLLIEGENLSPFIKGGGGAADGGFLGNYTPPGPLSRGGGRNVTMECNTELYSEKR